VSSRERLVANAARSKRQVPSKDLLKRVQAGKPDALADLYSLYGNIVYQTALGVMSNRSDAEDVLQDVFVGLPGIVGKFTRRGSFEGWLRRVTVRRALIELRRRRTHLEVPLDDSRVTTIDRQLARVEDKITLHEAVKTLSEEQRAVFNLRAVQGWSHTEIGEFLGISGLASRSRFCRAMAQVQTVMRESE